MRNKTNNQSIDVPTINKPKSEINSSNAIVSKKTWFDKLNYGKKILVCIFLSLLAIGAIVAAIFVLYNFKS